MKSDTRRFRMETASQSSGMQTGAVPMYEGEYKIQALGLLVQSMK